MIEDHWKPKLLLSLLPFLFLGGSLLPKECHGQAGGNGNFFYYYSPTQRTNINHGLPNGAGANFFNNPFLNQQSSPQIPQNVQNQQLQQPQPQSSFQFPSFQQSTLLGFNHPNFQQQQQSQQSPAFQQPSPFQFPSIQPTPATQPSQQQFLRQTSPTFSTFTSFGPNAQFFGSRNAPIPQPSQSPFFPTQSPLGTVAPGAFNFFQSPFQYLQQRFLQDTTTTQVTPTLAPVPAMHSIPTAPTTTAVPPSPPAPTPTEMMMDPPEPEQVIERRPKFSSRFRYVQQPPLQQQQQYNPYTRLGTPYTSDLPYMEQRFYSSPTSPTGYAFSLGGDQGSGATSTVHFSMGPLNKINQYLTEVSATRRLLQRQRTQPTTASVQEISVPETTHQMVAAQDEEALPQNAPSSPEPTMGTPMITSTTTEAPTPAPSPSTPEPMTAMEEVPAASPVSESMNSTLEPLLNEPSLQTETITSPVVQIHELPTARKASETSIPKRLVIRKKVARKRLRLDGSGETVDAGGAPMPVGVMIRRIVSSNRLPTEETKLLENDSPKGFVADIPASTLSTTTTTTTEAAEPEQMPHIPEMQSEEEHDQLSQDSPAEPQQSSSPQPMMMMPVEESHMMKMEEQPEEPQQPMTPAPSQMPEQMPAMLENQPQEMPQPSSEEMMSSTTATPIQQPPVESLMSQEPQPAKENDAEEYFEDYYEDDNAPPAVMSNTQTHSRIMTAVKAPESDDELPILNGVQKTDFPGVFHPNASPLDNSVETDQGEVITRITSSHPSESAEVQEVSPPEAPEASPSPVTIPQSSTTTTEASQPEFMREDPLEEQPPQENEVPATPAFQPTSEANVPMMTTTPAPMISSTTESSSQEQENESGAMQPEEIHMDSSSTTEQPEDHMEQMVGTTMSTSTEATPQQQDQEMKSQEDEDLPELMNDPVMSVSSTTESIMMSSNADNEDSTSMPQMELANPSSTEIVSSSTSTPDNDEMVTGSSTTVAPPLSTTESYSQDQQMNMDDSNSNNSQENYDENLEGHHHDQPTSEEQALDSEEIGKVQRLALEETLKRLRERQMTSSTSDPLDDGENSPENDVQTGRKMFSRRPLQVSNLPLPTSGPVVNKNAVLPEEEGLDRSQVVEKIRIFREKYGRGSTTTTKKPRRVTRPSPSTERRLAVVSPVEDLVGSQEQVDSFSDSSSSTPGAAVDETVTTEQPQSTTPMPYRTTTRRTSFITTTPSSTTTMPPFLEESSTTSAPTLEDQEEEVNYPTYSTTTTESYEQQQTTRQPPPQTLTTRMTESTTSQPLNDEFSSTTEIDFETVNERNQPADEMTSTTTTSTTESSMMMTITTTEAPAFMESSTTPSTTTSTTTTSTMTDFSDDSSKDMPKNDYDVFYSEEENMETAKNLQVSSSTETSTEAGADDNDEMDSSSQSSPSSTTIAPLSTSTDASYTMTTTSEPNSGSAATTTMNPPPDMMTTTSAGQLIIHEILPTMPPLKEVSFVIGESVEDDQSAAVDNNISNRAETSDELLQADKAVVRVEANVHVLTNTTTDFDTSSSFEQSSEELTQNQQTPNSTTTTSVESSGEQGQRRVRIVVKRQRRLRRPDGPAMGSRDSGRDGRRRRRKVLHRRPQ